MKKNEEWDAILPSNGAGQSADVAAVEERRGVTFATAAEVDGAYLPSTIPGPIAYDDADMASWYREEDCHQFMRDAIGRAETINHAMAYTTRNESTFNKSTGMTSP